MFHRLVHLSGGAGILVGLSLLFCLPFHLVWFAVPPNAQAQLDRGLRITELQYDPPGLDEEREWVELANLGEETLTLVGYGLGDAAQRGSREGMLRFPAGITAGPGQTIIVARTALGFRALFGFNPDLELQETDTAVPNMLADTEWATGQFALANDGDDLLLLDPDGLLVDGLNYGDRDTLFSPSVPLAVVGQSLQRVPAGCDTDSALEWQALSPPTPGTLPVGADCPSLPETLGAEKQDLLRIGEIQGKGDTSPFLNQQVAFSGIVTGVLEDQNAAGIIYYTLFIQDATGEVDGDPDSSDGIAVFYGRNRPPYANGDLVEVRGRVTEYYG
ncbi:MAG: lamin tail domain-containing protein, partial [Candidatus Promineifilaceae bacterium]